MEIPRSGTYDMSLNELIDLAKQHVQGHQGWTKWLEDYYDPAKSGLVDLLMEHGIVVDDEENWFEEAMAQPQGSFCEKCGVKMVPWGGAMVHATPFNACEGYTFPPKSAEEEDYT